MSAFSRNRTLSVRRPPSGDDLSDASRRAIVELRWGVGSAAFGSLLGLVLNITGVNYSYIIGALGTVAVLVLHQSYTVGLLNDKERERQQEQRRILNFEANLQAVQDAFAATDEQTDHVFRRQALREVRGLLDKMREVAANHEVELVPDTETRTDVFDSIFSAPARRSGAFVDPIDSSGRVILRYVHFLSDNDTLASSDWQYLFKAVFQYERPCIVQRLFIYDRDRPSELADPRTRAMLEFHGLLPEPVQPSESATHTSSQGEPPTGGSATANRGTPSSPASTAAKTGHGDSGIGTARMAPPATSASHSDSPDGARDSAHAGPTTLESEKYFQGHLIAADRFRQIRDNFAAFRKHRPHDFGIYGERMVFWWYRSSDEGVEGSQGHLCTSPTRVSDFIGLFEQCWRVPTEISEEDRQSGLAGALKELITDPEPIERNLAGAWKMLADVEAWTPPIVYGEPDVYHLAEAVVDESYVNLSAMHIRESSRDCLSTGAATESRKKDARDKYVERLATRLTYRDGLQYQRAVYLPQWDENDPEFCRIVQETQELLTSTPGDVEILFCTQSPAVVDVLVGDHSAMISFPTTPARESLRIALVARKNERALGTLRQWFNSYTAFLREDGDKVKVIRSLKDLETKVPASTKVPKVKLVD